VKLWLGVGMDMRETWWMRTSVFVRVLAFWDCGQWEGDVCPI
jgi:hypothetical protein